jgi:hypothetical protein
MRMIVAAYRSDHSYAAGLLLAFGLFGMLVSLMAFQQLDTLFAFAGG